MWLRRKLVCKKQGSLCEEEFDDAAAGVVIVDDDGDDDDGDDDDNDVWSDCDFFDVGELTLGE